MSKNYCTETHGCQHHNLHCRYPDCIWGQQAKTVTSTKQANRPIRRGLYVGSFDPVTYGHLSVITEARKIFDEVIIGVAYNQNKIHKFDVTRRRDMIKEHCPNDKIIILLSGLTVHIAEELKCTALIRGIRAASEFDYEFSLNIANRRESGIPTVFVPAAQEHLFTSSSMVRELAKNNGDVSHYVPANVQKALNGAFSKIEAKYVEQ